MNKLLFIFILLVSFKSFAQEEPLKFHTHKNAIKISPMRALTYKFNVEFERKITPYFSAGVISDVYYKNLFNLYADASRNGIHAIKNSLYTRVYPWGNGLNGFYAQAKIIMVAQYNNYYINQRVYKLVKDSIGNVPELIHSSSVKKSSISTVFGGSIGFGYQALLGKQKRFSLDSKIEIQLVPSPHISDENYITEEYYDKNGNFLFKEEDHFEEGVGYDNFNWVFAGPGALIYPSIKIGYLF